MTDPEPNLKLQIANAFLDHLKRMTKDDWEPLFDHWLSSGEAKLKAASNFATNAAIINKEDRYAWLEFSQKALGIAWKSVGVSEVSVAQRAVANFAVYATDEIFGSSFFCQRGQPFNFLPMFGFADEQAIIFGDPQ